MEVGKKNWQWVKVSDLNPAPWNYKDEDEEMEKKLFESMKKDGVIESLLIRELEDGRLEVCNGNHRLSLLAKLGVKEVMCVNKGRISQAEAERLTIGLNETRFPLNDIKFGRTLKHMTSEITIEDMAVTIPFETVEIEDYIKMADFRWEDLQGPVSSPIERHEDMVILKFSCTEQVAALVRAQLDRFMSKLQCGKERALELIVAEVSTIPDEQLFNS